MIADPDLEVKLSIAFEDWLDEAHRYLTERGNDMEEGWACDRYFARVAQDLTKGLNPSIDQLHAVVAAHQDDDRRYGIPAGKYADDPEGCAESTDRMKCIADAGMFLTGVYNTLPQQFILYDQVLENPPNLLGCFLEPSKILVITGKAGNNVGSWNNGLIINLGEVGDYCGSHTDGPIINFGKAGEAFGLYHITNYAVNIGRVDKSHPGVLDAKDKPELIKYLGELRARLEQAIFDSRSADKLLADLGPEPRDKIEDEICEVMPKAGY